MGKIRCAIVDDEPLALELIESYVSRIDKFQLTGKCKNGEEAYNLIKTKQIDLLFLDIQMPFLTGVELLKAVQKPPKVIFTTAYQNFALESYELNAVDYLVKPISFERFLKAVDKVCSSPVAIPRMEEESEASFLYVKADKKMIKIFFNEIESIEGMKDYVKIRIASGKEIVTHKTLQDFEIRLPANKFLRVHRSFIVSVDKINAYTSTGIELKNRIIPIGKLYKNEVVKKLGN